MKTYINHRIGMLIILLLGVCFSCSKTNDLRSFDPQAPELSLKTNVVEATKEGGDFTVSIESNLPWRAKSDVDWITFSSENALGDGDIVFSIGRNRSADPRSAEITIWITKDYEKKIQVIQAPADPSDLITHYYVKTSGTEGNSGLSWAEPTTLDKALDEVVQGDVINIAAGTYTPTQTITGGSGSNAGDITFEIHSNISLIGGYSANATEGAIADPSSHETILSGNAPTGRVFHTVAITAPAQSGQKVVLKGLSIKHGQAAASGTGNISINGAPYYRFYAGGLIVARSVVDIIDCEISDNESRAHAGGVYVFSGATVRFERSAVINNKGTSTSSNGGGIFIEASTVYFNDCIVSGNTTTGVGAGIYSFHASQPTYTYIYNTTVAYNNNDIGNFSPTRRGGGFYAREHSVTVIVNSTFYGNIGGHGAGISLYGGTAAAPAPSKLDIINSTITGNNAFNNGGGIETGIHTTLSVYNSILSGNTAGNNNELHVGGGGVTGFSSSVRGTQLLDGNGGIISGQSFDFATMLGSLTDNGGHTQTVLLSPGSPATTLGMSVSQLQNLGNTYSPAI
ncbi:MAG TPA: BACON domain-containing carbohydrate-binding protein, partial [Sphingobacterium sp.]|nr:BACON domain-containing carbohydrate-binding protein [Sphingobacterium sp.]